MQAFEGSFDPERVDDLLYLRNGETCSIRDLCHRRRARTESAEDNLLQRFVAGGKDAHGQRARLALRFRSRLARTAGGMSVRKARLSDVIASAIANAAAY